MNELRVAVNCLYGYYSFRTNERVSRKMGVGAARSDVFGKCNFEQSNERSTFFIIKPTRCTNFTNLYWHETLHVSDSSSIHHQAFILCTLSFRAGPGWNCSSILVLLEKCLQICMTYTIAECTVNELLMMDRGIVRNV